MQIFKKEKRVVGLINEHIDKTSQCFETAIESMKADIAGTQEEQMDLNGQVHLLESEADTLLREIRELLYSGAYLPIIRGEIYRLMSAVDNVTNKIEDCSEFFHYQRPAIPPEFQSEFNSMLDQTAECFQQFRKALKHYFGPKDKIEKVRLRTLQVGELESEIDNKERTLTAQIFRSSLDLSEKIHLQQSLRQIAVLSDVIEDAADELELVCVKTVL